MYACDLQVMRKKPKKPFDIEILWNSNIALAEPSHTVQLQMYTPNVFIRSFMGGFHRVSLHAFEMTFSYSWCPPSAYLWARSLFWCHISVRKYGANSYLHTLPSLAWGNPERTSSKNCDFLRPPLLQVMMSPLLYISFYKLFRFPLCSPLS